MGSHIAGNSAFPLYPNASIKCNKTRILQATLSPGLPVANCIIISVCGCHLLLPSQGLVHNKKCSFFLRRLLTSLRAECLITCQDETFTWVFTESSDRAKAGGFNTSCCKLVQIQLRIHCAREYWTVAVGHCFVKPTAAEKTDYKKKADQGDKKSLKPGTYHTAKQILSQFEWPGFAPAIKWATHFTPLNSLNINCHYMIWQIQSSCWHLFNFLLQDHN